MSSPALDRPHTPKPRLVDRSAPPKRGQKRTIIAVIVAAGLAIALVLWNDLSPYAREPVLQDLAEASDSVLTIRSFYRIHFPFPGCVIEGLVFHHGSKTAPLFTVEKVTIRGSYLGLLTRHVPRITAEGMRITIPAFGTSEPFHTHPSKIIVDEIDANGTVLEFEHHNPGKEAVRFDIHEASLRNVGWSGPMHYHLKVHNPDPPGEVTLNGDFGAWQHGDAEETPLSGDYRVEDEDLGVYHGIRGKLSSQGHFGGVLKHIDIAGSIDIPDFEVRNSGHPVQLRTDYSAYVDGRNGDTYLNQVDAHFKRTHVIAEGSVVHTHGIKGKTTKLQLAIPKGRIEDALGLFVREPRAPMSGETSLRAKVEIPPSNESFLRKLRLDGSFGIDEGSFTKAQTQTNVNKLSAGARGENKDDPENVLSDLKGQVSLRGGVANFSDLSFGIPGAAARMQGTYGVIDYKVNLHGTMQVQSKISNTTTGMKAALLKLMDPFFKKKKNGEIVPVHIMGTYDHPQFGLDVREKNSSKSSSH